MRSILQRSAPKRLVLQRSVVRFLIPFAAAALVTFAPPCGAPRLLAIVLPVQAIPAIVQEVIFPNNPVKTQYTVSDISSAQTAGGPFDITLFLVTTTGGNPTTTNSNWTAQTVDATAWAQPMPEVADDNPISWQTYTGLTYTQAFPNNPIKVNGYFTNYMRSLNNGENTVLLPDILRDTTLGGFFFDGSPSSTFFAAGPADSTQPFTPGAVVSFSGPTTEIPEPASLALATLAAFAACGLLGSRRHRRRNPTSAEKLPLRYNVIAAALVILIGGLAGGVGNARAEVLYGDAFISGQPRFVTIDSTTGAVAPLGPALTADGLYDVSTVNASAGKYFCIAQAGSDAHVVTIDIATGNVLANPTLPNPPPNAFEFDSSSGQIHGHSYVSGLPFFVNTDPNSGNVSAVGGALPVDGVYSDSALDAAGHRYFMFGLQSSGPTRILSVDSISGSVVQDHALSDNAPSAIAYDPSNGDVVGQSVIAGQVRFITVDPLTGNIAPLGPAIAGLIGITDIGAIDPADDRYFMVGSDSSGTSHIITVSSQYGNLIDDEILSNNVVTMEVVPEPATAWLLILASAGLVSRRAR